MKIHSESLGSMKDYCSLVITWSATAPLRSTSRSSDPLTVRASAIAPSMRTTNQLVMDVMLIMGRRCATKVGGWPTASRSRSP